MTLSKSFLGRMPFDLALRQLLSDQAVAAAGTPPPATDEDLLLSLRATHQRALDTRTSILGLPNAVSSQDVSIAPGLMVRIYTPPGEPGPLPLLVYLHGGGWVMGSVATFDPFCRLLCCASGVGIVSVNYRLAPEYPYPAALQDALTAVNWATAHGGDYGGDVTAIALGGDSSGGNVAAAAANRLCASGEHGILKAQMLLYPVTDHPSANHLSYTENGTGYGLEAKMMHWFWKQYAQGVSPDDPNISPLRLPNFPNLPSTLVTTSEYDPLRDDGLAYAEKLKSAGVDVTHLHQPDMGHNFPVSPNLVGRFPQCSQAISQIAAWLKSSLTNKHQ